MPISCPMTLEYLPPVWTDTGHWQHDLGGCNFTEKSGWVLYSWLLEDPLWDDSRDLHSGFFIREARLFYLMWIVKYFTLCNSSFESVHSWFNCELKLAPTIANLSENRSGAHFPWHLKMKHMPHIWSLGELVIAFLQEAHHTVTIIWNICEDC